MLVNMKDILAPARRDGYAVGFFNAVNVEMARAIIETAEELRSPVMVGTAEVLLPPMELEFVADYLLPLARRATVPVCVHYDHGLTYERCIQALRLGFSSIMYDCSTLPYEQNADAVAGMVRLCHAVGVSVEGELGHVGDNEGEGALARPSDYYTDPDCAADYCARTGIDSLAVAVGNAHGAYRFPPKLDFGRISEIAEKTGLPLVLHGGSGLSDDDFREAARRGVAKVNIFTDIDRAGAQGLEKGLAAGVRNMLGLIPYEIEAIKAEVARKLRVFGSVDRV